MSEPTSISLLKRSNGYWYILYEVNGRIRWKLTHSRSKQEAARAITCLNEVLKPKQSVVLLSRFRSSFA